MPDLYRSSDEKFAISTDPKLLDMETVYEFLERAYWAKARPRERTQQAFSNSLVFGLYSKTRLIGIARVVTDYSVVAYLCDVFIHEDFRGCGLGVWLVQTVLDHPDLQHVRRWLLATSDAHGLYQKFGFDRIPEPEKWMQRLKPHPGE